MNRVIILALSLMLLPGTILAGNDASQDLLINPCCTFGNGAAWHGIDCPEICPEHSSVAADLREFADACLGAPVQSKISMSLINDESDPNAVTFSFAEKAQGFKAEKIGVVFFNAQGHLETANSIVAENPKFKNGQVGLKFPVEFLVERLVVACLLDNENAATLVKLHFIHETGDADAYYENIYLENQARAKALQGSIKEAKQTVSEICAEEEGQMVGHLIEVISDCRRNADMAGASKSTGPLRSIRCEADYVAACKLDS